MRLLGGMSAVPGSGGNPMPPNEAGPPPRRPEPYSKLKDEEVAEIVKLIIEGEDRLCQEFEQLALLVDELIFLVKDGDK